MQTIWKFELEIEDVQTISVPIGGVSLTVMMQNDKLCLWMRVADDGMRVDRTIEIVGTGNSMEHAKRRYIGSVIDDPFVWHVFERV